MNIVIYLSVKKNHKNRWQKKETCQNIQPKALCWFCWWFCSVWAAVGCFQRHVSCTDRRLQSGGKFDFVVRFWSLLSKNKAIKTKKFLPHFFVFIQILKHCSGWKSIRELGSSVEKLLHWQQKCRLQRWVCFGVKRTRLTFSWQGGGALMSCCKLTAESNKFKLWKSVLEKKTTLLSGFYSDINANTQ